MKSLLMVLVLLGSLLTVSGPSHDAVQIDTDTTDDAYSIRLVENLLRYPSQLGSGFGEKQLARLGDRVSIALLKILGEDELAKPERIRTLIPLVRAAFLEPKLISLAEDRKPNVTVFLLKHLKQEAKDPQLKKEVSDLTDYVKQKTDMRR
jgi:hypothetical protein